MSPLEAVPPPSGNAPSPQVTTAAGRVPPMAVLAALEVVTFVVFCRALTFPFIGYDDDVFIYDNPLVKAGLTWRGIQHAFTLGSHLTWDPLTALSHMLDCQLYGLNAGGHHLTNLLLHLVAVGALFHALHQTTGALGKSAFVAAVFAVHPLRAETVVWVSDRTDVLSGMFLMLTVAMYASYARHRSRGAYVAVVALFALAMMSKPTGLMLPWVLLLLDVWPLNRFSRPNAGTLLVEKLPLLAISVAGSALGLLFRGPAIRSLEQFPLEPRIENALHSGVVYLVRLFFPAGLAVYYPQPTAGLPTWQPVAAGAVLLAVSVAAVRWRREHPYLLVGWAWYLFMLLPVSGVLQVGMPASADRYTYVPLIGVTVAVTWMAARAWAALRRPAVELAAAGCVVVLALGAGAFQQAGYWQDGIALWTRDLEVAESSSGHNNLGYALMRVGRQDEAIIQFQKALESPSREAFVYAHYNLGNILLHGGSLDLGIQHLEQAVQAGTRYALAENRLGEGLVQAGRVDEATAHFRKALEFQPELAVARINLVAALEQKGQAQDVEAVYGAVPTTDPGYAAAQGSLGTLLWQKGRRDSAMGHLRNAVEAAPADPSLRYTLGVMLFEERNLAAAILQLSEAIRLQPDHVEARINLGISLFQQGQVDPAVAQFRKVLQLQPDSTMAQNNLGRVAWLLATSPLGSVRDGKKAVEIAESLVRHTGGSNIPHLTTLAAALAEAGRFSDAVSTDERALQLAAGQLGPDSPALAPLKEQLRLFQEGRPYHESSGP